MQFGTERLTPRFYQYSDPPTRFGATYRDDLKNASNITLLLQANVVALEADESATHVRVAKLRALDGSVGEVRAKRFVLACGAVENARLLLLSNSAAPAGLGNHHGLVGRYFMQHPHVAVATLRTGAADVLESIFAQHAVGTAKVRASLSPSAAVQEERGLLNCAATLDRTPDPVTGYGALRSVWRDIRQGQWPEQLGSRMRRAFGDPGSMADSDELMTLYMRSEQAPNPDSRITLSDARDALGLRRARIDWRLSDTDKRTLAEGATSIGESLSGMGLGRVRLAPWLQDADADWPAELWGGCHHMGTTRMSRTAESGVVDEQCRVHGIDNLYVAGSSVFPTGGYANPTLTIVALALRLAEHLRDSA
jgi:choline dehydrogenase-like flavoprotein